MLKPLPVLFLLSFVGSYLHGITFEVESDPIRYLNHQTINRPISKIEFRLISSEEGMPDDTLYQHLSAEGMPVFYSRNIRTSVCFDNKCRLLKITLYWNPSGRYLGFVLPENEYLSKKDHDPFSESEYEKLNQLLADPNLPLGTISYNELVLASKPSIQGVDGVSGATSKDMLAYVIEGAAYTTHKMYAIIYGPSQLAVKEWTLEKLSEEFIQEVISSSTIWDIFWGLEILKGKLEIYPGLTPEILEIISSNDFSLSEKALSVFVSEDLNDSHTQSEIIEAFALLDVGRKKSVLELLKGEAVLLPHTVEFLNTELPKMEIPLIVLVIDIYKANGIKDQKSQLAIGSLTSSDNSYISKKAKDFIKWAQGI